MNEQSALYYNGKLFTCDSKQPYAQAMIVDGRRIVWVGDDADIPAVDFAKRVDLGCRRVLPGFIDNHMHPVTLAEYSRQISILPPETLPDSLPYSPSNFV